ncbi:winged helix-turn-helix transcriptional regulator [Saccharopolyspora pogona]|uniref:winged helix-turn-helix transcriptional regulator n=1 Tax=Saccharopolyspora pogona TaxID=333966 RepID=UPI001CC25DB0|nr:helix-turn-helix domain-containing protein [Saccharopolyspora pogona]
MKLDGPLADRDAWRATRCSVDLALTVVGTRSAMLLLREAFYGTTRFHDFTSRIGITDANAADRLKDLVDIGVFEKRPYREEGQRTRYEYLLTDMGRALLPAVLALMQWGDTYLQGDGGPLRVVEDSTGAPVHVHVCTTDGSKVSLDELRVRRPRKARRRGASE